jgi:hypothetical protein
MSPLPNIYFEWNHYQYFIPADTRGVQRIIIPDDGSVLEFSVDDQFLPPVIKGLRGLCFSVVPHNNHSNLKSIARYLKAAVDVKIAKVEFIKKCPNGHPNQNDVFCSLCGRRLYVEEIITRWNNTALAVKSDTHPCPHCKMPVIEGERICPSCNEKLFWINL